MRETIYFFDTQLYISPREKLPGFISWGAQKDAELTAGVQTALSPIVLHELAAGARSPRLDDKALRGALNHTKQTNGMIRLLDYPGETVARLIALRGRAAGNEPLGSEAVICRTTVCGLEIDAKARMWRRLRETWRRRASGLVPDLQATKRMQLEELLADPELVAGMTTATLEEFASTEECFRRLSREEREEASVSILPHIAVFFHQGAQLMGNTKQPPNVEKHRGIVGDVLATLHCINHSHAPIVVFVTQEENIQAALSDAGFASHVLSPERYMKMMAVGE
jgi:hypothetical protein